MEEYLSDKAYDKIQELIPDDKKNISKPVIDSISKFHDKDFRLTIDVNYKSSRHVVNAIPFDNGITLKGEIELKPSDRTTESLTHELLHLFLPFKGYPIIFAYPTKISDTNSDAISKVMNLVEHDIMLDMYLQMDYSKDRFMTISEPIDYRNEKLIGTSQQWWLMEFFRHWITIFHVDQNLVSRLEDSIESITQIGKAKSNEFLEKVTKIKSWYFDKRFHNPDKYTFEINKLLRLFDLPEIISYLKVTDEFELEEVKI